LLFAQPSQLHLQETLKKTNKYEFQVLYDKIISLQLLGRKSLQLWFFSEGLKDSPFTTVSKRDISNFVKTNHVKTSIYQIDLLHFYLFQPCQLCMTIFSCPVKWSRYSSRHFCLSPLQLFRTSASSHAIFHLTSHQFLITSCQVQNSCETFLLFSTIEYLPWQNKNQQKYLLKSLLPT
jgi:hypothetical protein